MTAHEDGPRAGEAQTIVLMWDLKGIMPTGGEVIGGLFQPRHENGLEPWPVFWIPKILGSQAGYSQIHSGQVAAAIGKVVR